MSSTLNASLEERQTFPYAIGIHRKGEPVEYVHFMGKGFAALYADILEGPDTIVTRWVALTEPEYSASALTPGWRQVTAFVI